MSRSTPNIVFTLKKNFTNKSFNYSKSHAFNYLPESNQSCDLSTSLPLEAQTVINYHSKRRVSRVSESMDLVYNSECPSTPPPSPRKNQQNPLFFPNQSKSSQSSSSEETMSANESYKTNKKKTRKTKNCAACTFQNSPMVSIKLIFIDSNHPKYKTKFSEFNKFIKVKFTDLQMNVNPESWIILLDMLGKN